MYTVTACHTAGIAQELLLRNPSLSPGNLFFCSHPVDIFSRLAIDCKINKFNGHQEFLHLAGFSSAKLWEYKGFDRLGQTFCSCLWCHILNRISDFLYFDLSTNSTLNKRYLKLLLFLKYLLMMTTAVTMMVVVMVVVFRMMLVFLSKRWRWGVRMWRS